MKLDWIDSILILFGLFIAYQLLRAILGGSWQTEGLIIALLVFNLGLTWKLSLNVMKSNMKFERHIGWHKARDNKK
ncbi:hypothetical protein CMI37_07750 [Candidatus Pacearchaeota archaeon]|nr:hypothetical protein [Candidatus Pacearchaeota archaeon]